LGTPTGCPGDRIRTGLAGDRGKGVALSADPTIQPLAGNRAGRWTGVRFQTSGCLRFKDLPVDARTGLCARRFDRFRTGKSLLDPDLAADPHIGQELVDSNKGKIKDRSQIARLPGQLEKPPG